jgi:hypothetical protein
MRNGEVVQHAFGGAGSGALPAPGDYDGDGTTDLGVHDVSLNQWRWQSSWTGSNTTESFGPCGGWPVQGYYDHDRMEDFAQVFPFNNDYYVWLVKRTAEPIINPYYYEHFTNYHGQSYQLSTEYWRVSW